MTARYRVWNTDRGKLVGAFDSEAEALEKVRVLAGTGGHDAADLGLKWVRDDGSLGEPLFGAELVARAIAACEADEP